ncbi:amidohydrolase family protein [Nakamurella sp. YIM 132087]|uniref:Amidohydrolase family protein n=1 Tax=Nakamurella alba TaxID=2665158 RepID=A0A7K1FN84_9ACTN|nr:amidohydrolase family protein [Nakamurella alba]MTD14244.1 amidohydrolase family protein [Nakamurella alba]
MTGHVLSGVRLWDGRTDRGLVDLTVSGGLVTEVVPAAGPDSGLSVIPGLVDTHVHLIGFAGGRDRVKGFDTFTWPLVTEREEQSLHGAANAQRAMRAGVTSLRDLGADETQAAVARVFDLGVMDGPRLHNSGPVGMTAGHLDLFTPRAVKDRPPTADSPDECRALVRRWARTGMTGIKIYTSGGVLSMGDKVGWRNHTRGEIAATVDEAHALGMTVACHTHSAEGIDIALEEGVDSIEHGTGLTPEQAVVLAERGIPVAPTLLINDMIARADVPVSDEAQEIAAELMVHRDKALADAASAGVDFVLGTDANGYFLEFGDQWLELRRMAEVLGWSAERTLQAGTSRAAAALRSDVGVLEPGRPADLVVMRGRPWEDVAAMDRHAVTAVICRGRVVAGGLL